MESQNFDVVSIQDTILAGMYSNGYIDLETVNKDLFVAVNSWNKMFAKIDSNDTNIIKTLLISLSQSLINFDKKVLYVCENEEDATTYNKKFNEILKFVDNVDSGINDSNAKLIFTWLEGLQEFEDIGYVVVDNSLTSELVEKLNYAVNYAIFIQTNLTAEITQLVEKLNTKETQVFMTQEQTVEEQAVEEQAVEEQAVEEQAVEKQAVEEQVVEEQAVEEQEEDSSDSDNSIDLQEILKELNIETIDQVNKNKKQEEKKKKQNLLIRMAGRRR